jgi:ubiquinone/menaquinone biosynthesis C-methylase UbiE
MASYFDGCATGWDERTGAPGASHLAPLAVAVTKIDRRPERALDIGTGTGVAALFVAREFPHASVRGVDISEEMIRQAKGKVGLDPDARVAFRVADASRLPYDDGHFDLVTQINMPPFFAEIARVLRHGGHAIVAASSGDRTPFYTPDAVLERGFGRHDMVAVTSGRIGSGSYFVARKGE